MAKGVSCFENIFDGIDEDNDDMLEVKSFPRVFEDGFENRRRIV